MRLRLAFASLVAASGLAGALQGQETAPPSSAQPTDEGVPPPPAGGMPDRYIEVREQGQRQLGGRLNSVGRTANLSAIRALVQANLRRRQYTMPITGGTPEKLQQLDVEDVAQFLATLGYTASELAPGNPRALELVQAAGRAVLGGASFRDMVFLSPIIVVGEVVDIQPDTQTDTTYRSTATIKVNESLKGGLAVGSTIKFRLQSGAVENGLYLRLPSEIQRDNKGPYLLFLSDAAYEVRGGRAKRAGESIFSTAGTPHLVVGDLLRPLGDTEAAGSSLAEARSYAR